MTFNPFKWFTSSSLESSISLVLRVGGIASEVWQTAKAHVIAAEGTERDGAGKFDWAVKALLTLFPGLAPAWAGVIIQLAWLLLENTAWKASKAA